MKYKLSCLRSAFNGVLGKSVEFDALWFKSLETALSPFSFSLYPGFIFFSAKYLNIQYDHHVVEL